MSAVPTIYTRIQPALPMRLGGRLIAFGIAAACLVTLLVAVRLPPSASGMGTHERLGLQSCGWLQRTGLPCPTCGMTTSYAHFVRGRWLASFYVQPMGFIMAMLTAVVFWIALYETITGKPIHRLLVLLPISYHLLPLMALVVIAWAWKMFIHVRRVDGWQ